MNTNPTEHTASSPQRPKKRSSGIPRSPNWCMSEIRALCGYIRNHSTNILGSATDTPGRNAIKRKHWQRVTRLINERYGQNRVWKQVRKKWVDLTYSAKTYQKSNQVQDSGCASSDGSSDNENLTPVIKEVLSALENPKHPYEEIDDHFSRLGDGTSQIIDDSSDLMNGSFEMSSDSESEVDDEFINRSGQNNGIESKKRRHSYGVKQPEVQAQRRLRSTQKETDASVSTHANRNAKCRPESYSRPFSRNLPNFGSDENSQRYGGARRQFSSPGTSNSSQNWKERFNIVDKLISQSDAKNEQEISSVTTFRKEMLEIEKQKASTAKAKLSIMQECLHLRRQQLEVQKTTLFYIKSISVNLDTSASNRRHFQEMHPTVSTEKFPTVWDLPRTGHTF